MSDLVLECLMSLKEQCTSASSQQSLVSNSVMKAVSKWTSQSDGTNVETQHLFDFKPQCLELSCNEWIKNRMKVTNTKVLTKTSGVHEVDIPSSELAVSQRSCGKLR